MENINQNLSSTQPTQSVAPVQPPPTHHSHKLLMGLGVLLLLALGAAGGYLFANQNNQVVNQSPQPTIAIQTSPTEVPSIPDKSTFTYKTFSFSYPSSWTASDTTTNKEFFTKNRLDGFDHEVILEKGNDLLFIGIDKEPNDNEVGGIFVTEKDFQDWKSSRDEVTVQENTFYLLKTHTALSTLTDPNTHGGIFGFASLSEYVPNKIKNAQNQTVDGYEDYIQNKNGYSYVFVKLSKSSSSNLTTSAETQQEFVEILESIKW